VRPVPSPAAVNGRENLPSNNAQQVRTPSSTVQAQDFLFISYAWEDAALADWLVRQLTAHGYRVWCDRFQMLGGESFPKVIDQAIKNRTFRLIALLSRHSIDKPNPRKERTLALNLSRERNIDFMIPLNVDGLKPSELSWDYSDLSYISFSNWAAGLEQLLKALAKAEAPRPLTEEEGRRLAAETFLPQHVVVERPEKLFTNCFEFKRIPERLYVVEWKAGQRDLEFVPVVWPYYELGNNRSVAFSLPPNGIDASLYKQISSPLWRDVESIEAVRSRDIVSNLLWQSLVRTLLKRRLKRDPGSGLFYFPAGMLPHNKIRYSGRSGRKTWVAVLGEKTFRGKPYRYHLVPDYQIRQDLGQDFVAQLKLRVLLTDKKGNRLDKVTSISRRKHLSSSWFNHHWLSRVLAISSFLAKGKESITLLDKSDPVILSALPIAGEVGIAIDEEHLRGLRQQIEPGTPGWEEEETEEV
jgi:TIR domain